MGHRESIDSKEKAGVKAMSVGESVHGAQSLQSCPTL